jgi:tetratricopeptide (TPR) repeat protein
MTGPLTITLEPAKALSATAEARLLQDALAKNPASAVLQRKMGKVFNELDLFGETIALLAPTLDTLDSDTALVLAHACFAKQDNGHLTIAQMAADRALSVASNNSGQARAMADQAKVRLRLGENEAAITILQAALALDRHSVAAFKRLSVQLLRQGDLALAEQLTSGLIAEGICHSRVLAARTVALAAMGRNDDARSTTGIARFLHRAPIEQPPDHYNLAQYNTALNAELTSSPAIRQDRFGTASALTERLDSPIANATPLWIALLEQVARAVERWANSLSPVDHPWLTARPERALLRSWCVITNAEGYERWHMHPDGWISGGYYPLVPPGFGRNSGKPGSIAFGLPDGLPGADAAMRFGEVSVQPEAGELILFPSHAYHRTYPHGMASQRICIAFDVIPA